MLYNEDTDIEALRRKLLDEVYAMALSGLGAAILDEGTIRHADEEELLEIAQQYGIR